MSEKTFVPCCADAEALVLIAAIPLCQVDSSEELLRFVAERIAAPDGGVSAPELASLAFTGGDPLADDLLGCDAPSASCGVPLRCAAAMPCADALQLLRDVGHVSF